MVNNTTILTLWMLLLMLPAHYSLAQQNDTTSYFPYKKGDIMVYEVCESIFCEAEVRVEVTDDSIDTDGNRWIKTRKQRFLDPDKSFDSNEYNYKIDSAGNIYSNEWVTFSHSPTELPLVLNDTAAREQIWIADTAIRSDGHKDTLFAKQLGTTRSVIFNGTDSVKVKLVTYSRNSSFFSSFSLRWAQGWGVVNQSLSEPGPQTGLKGVVKKGQLFGDTTLVYVSTEEPRNLPQTVTLHQNYPNPFNPSTTIRFDLRRAADISLSIYDITGREVATLLSRQRMSAGRHQLEWNAGEASSGIYFYRLNVNGQQMTRKMTLIK